MQKLTTDGFERARDFLRLQARPLEKAQFELEFEGGCAEAILSQLKEFQNPDGGFGQALEPDMRTPTSSALCTEIGLRYLAELETSADHPMVKAAVDYLLETFDAGTQIWRVIPEDANDYPHAPWWHNEDGSLARTFDDYLIIPRAGILAALYYYKELLPADWLTKVTEATVNYIMSLPLTAFDGGGDMLAYAVRLAQAQELGATDKARLVPHLKAAADAVVTRDPAKWAAYCAPPVKLAPTSQTITAEPLADCIPAHLDYLISTQSNGGYWDVTWSWSGLYPDVWEQARQEWRGVLTFDTLASLRAFGRV